jgi:hypothetical protein
MIYLPAAVAKDSQFPFKASEEVKIRIDGERLIAEKTEE